MKRFLQTDWPFITLITILSIFFIWGIQFIPFHPDEGTQFYMSSDLEALFTRPLTLSWDANKAEDPRQSYRELDAPITKYLLGLGRMITGFPALNIDWDWSLSWNENIQRGAIPDPRLLIAGRLTITLLLPLSLTFIYLIGKHIQGRMTGFVSALLLGTNAVVLLHGRRAMAEGALLFGITFGLWSIIQAQKRPWLTGIGLAIAFNAKQSAIALIPIGILASAWLPTSATEKSKKIVIRVTQFLALFGVITLALNPLYWRTPLQAVQASVVARKSLTARQTEDINLIAPDKYLETPVQRLFVQIANIYISPPTYGLVGNLEPIREGVDAYINVPGHNLFRNIIGGGILLMLTFFGIYLGLRDIITDESLSTRDLILLMLAMIFQWGAIIWAVPLPWVRFTIPLIPFSCLWVAYGLTRRLT